MRISNQPIDWRCYDVIERRYPELWQQCYPRRYEEPGKSPYDSPKAVARAMMDGLIAHHDTFRPGRTSGETEQNEALWASLMIKFQCPTYYLSRDMAVALTQTTPSEVLDCAGIKLPFPAAAFMLPKGILSHANYGDISFVAYSRMYGGAEVRCPAPNPEARLILVAPEDRFCFSIFLRTERGQTLHWTYDKRLRMVDLKNDAELDELLKTYSHESRIFEDEFDAADMVAMTRSIKLLFNIILLITHKPETVEEAQLVKRVRKGPGTAIEYWKPHIITGRRN